jgi:hypothetical protein
MGRPALPPPAVPPPEPPPQLWGAQIQTIYLGSPALGIVQAGDVIVKVNGEWLRSLDDLERLVAEASDGYLRLLVRDARSGQFLTVEVMLRARPFWLGVEAVLVPVPVPPAGLPPF